MLFHPPHSPDLSPCEYDLIPKLKEPLGYIRFQTVPDILRAVERSVKKHQQNRDCYRDTTPSTPLARLVDNAGDYIEGL